MSELRGWGWMIRLEDDPIRGPGYYWGRVDVHGRWIGRCEGPYRTHAAASEALDRIERSV